MSTYHTVAHRCQDLGQDPGQRPRPRSCPLRPRLRTRQHPSRLGSNWGRPAAVLRPRSRARRRRASPWCARFLRHDQTLPVVVALNGFIQLHGTIAVHYYLYNALPIRLSALFTWRTMLLAYDVTHSRFSLSVLMCRIRTHSLFPSSGGPQSPAFSGRAPHGRHEQATQHSEQNARHHLEKDAEQPEVDGGDRLRDERCRVEPVVDCRWCRRRWSSVHSCTCSAVICRRRGWVEKLRSVTCRQRANSVTCHPTEMNSPRYNPARQAGTRKHQ